MTEYREVVEFAWESERAIGIDLMGSEGATRVFVPKSILRDVGDKTYVPQWKLDKDAGSYVDPEGFLGGVIEIEEPRQGAIEVESLIAFFDAAAEHLKFPKVQLGGVKLSRSGPRAVEPFAVNVTDLGRYPDNKWYGRIERDGTWVPTQRTPEEVKETVQDFAADPVGYAAKIGRLHGACCFCLRELTDERSTKMGYGPVCARKYELPWGVTVQEAA